MEIVKGLDEGEVVLLREPKPHEVVARLNEKPAEAQALREMPEGAWARRDGARRARPRRQ